MAGKISLVLNGLLIIAVLFLFSSLGNGAGNTQGESGFDGGNADGLTVVYIMEDSILSGYDYVKEEGQRLEEKVTQKQMQIQQEMNTYQTEAARWEELLANSKDQETYNMAMQDMQKRERDIQAMQNSLENMKVQFSEDLTLRVQDYLKDYAADHGIDIILNDAQVGSSILYSTASLDVTADVLKGLNEEYAQEMQEYDEEEWL